MVEPTGGGPSPGSPPAPENPVPFYLGALVTGALVIGLAFFIKEASTKWIVVIVGIVMFISVLLAFAIEMAGQHRRT